MANIVAKLSTSTLGLKGQKAVANEGPTPLGRVWGIASGVKVTEDKRTGDFHQALTGTFAGVNYDAQGEEYRSGVLYLPKGVMELALAAVDSGEVTDTGKPIYNEIKFAFELIAVPSSAPIGYSWQAKQLVESASADPLSELASAMPALPGATAAPAIEGPKGEEKAAAKKKA